MTITFSEEVVRKSIGAIIVTFVVVGGGTWLFVNNQVRNQTAVSSQSASTESSVAPAMETYDAHADDMAGMDMSNMPGM
jgi:hypothetical protein